MTLPLPAICYARMVPDFWTGCQAIPDLKDGRHEDDEIAALRGFRFAGLRLKTKVALEAIRGDLTLAEPGAKHGIHHKMIAAWKRQARRE